MKRTGVLFAFCLFLAASFPAFAQNSAEAQERKEAIREQEELFTLLEGYLKNNLTVQSLSLAMQRAFLEHGISQYTNGLRFKLSSGTITIRTGEETTVSLHPQGSLSVPQLQNATFSLSSDIYFGPQDDTFSNISLKASADIISGSAKSRSLSKLKAEHDVLVAQRNLQNGFVRAETEFFEELKRLYNLAIEVIKAEKDLYDDQLSFEQIKAQGYRTTSSRYRTAQMQVLSDEHTVQSKTRELTRAVRIFASNCSAEYTAEDPLDFLPANIPEVDLVKVSDFERSTYTKIEDALWTQKINTLSRQAESAVTLLGNAGYTFKNTTTQSDTIDAGTSFSWNDTGLTLSAGASFPVGADSFSPVYTLSVGVDPLAFKIAALNNEAKQVDISKEELSLADAEQDYRTAVISQRSERENLLWQKQTYDENYSLYEEL